jgi:hypothetical protein
MATLFRLAVMLFAGGCLFCGCDKEDDPDPESELIVGNWEVQSYTSGGANLLSYYVNETRSDNCGSYQYEATGSIESFWEFLNNGTYSQTWITTYVDAYDYFNFYCQDMQHTNLQDIRTGTGEYSFLDNNNKLLMDGNYGVTGAYDLNLVSDQSFELERNLVALTQIKLIRN